MIRCLAKAECQKVTERWGQYFINISELFGIPKEINTKLSKRTHLPQKI